MKAKNSICRRCHRLKAVNAGGYCDSCTENLRTAERRRPEVGADNAALTPSLAPVETPSAPPPPFVLPTIDD